MTVAAIIPAGGQGLRMGGTVPKQFLEIDGQPVLRRTLTAFEESGVVRDIILVVPENEAVRVPAEWLSGEGIVRQVVPGGRQRQDSVYNGFKALDPGTEIVVVHDGVRPFVTPEIIRQTVDAARRWGAAIAAVPVNDTLKKVSEGFIERTVDRDGLWRVQTPQTFRYGLLRKALEDAFAQSPPFYGTDEAMLAERIGRPVKIVPGSEMNIKITRPEDLDLGRRILAGRAVK